MSTSVSLFDERAMSASSLLMISKRRCVHTKNCNLTPDTFPLHRPKDTCENILVPSACKHHIPLRHVTCQRDYILELDGSILMNCDRKIYIFVGCWECGNDIRRLTKQLLNRTYHNDTNVVLCYTSIFWDHPLVACRMRCWWLSAPPVYDHAYFDLLKTLQFRVFLFTLFSTRQRIIVVHMQWTPRNTIAHNRITRLVDSNTSLSIPAV